MTTELERNLSHSRAAYIFAVRSLPDPNTASWPVSQAGMTFSKPSEVKSMLIELGWAFFCRYEACVEVFLKSCGLKLTKKEPLEDWMSANGGIPPERSEPLRLYREIRNSLHHRDGESDGVTDKEIHLLPDHMDRFYEFFIWLGDEVWRRSNTARG